MSAPNDVVNVITRQELRIAKLEEAAREAAHAMDMLLAVMRRTEELLPRTRALAEARSSLLYALEKR